ncbi:MAG: FAD-dependent oxidoreductase, partial [Firmicutes bacterium]|nr:FAD-dependent oxidoreductase [Bacillota bacterium]
AREVDPTVEATMVLADDYPNYSICGLPMFLGGEVTDWHSLAHRTREELAAAGINVRTNTRALAVDPGTQTVRTAGPEGEADVPYDRLVIATGAQPVRPPIPGVDHEGVFLLHGVDDALAIDAFLATRAPERAVIVGAGYIGCEMADALTRRGVAVTLMEQAPAVLPTVDPELGGILGERMGRQGVEVLASVRVEAIERTRLRLRVRAAGGLSRTADMVLVVAGVRPVTDLARGLGLELGVRGAIRVARGMQTPVPNVWAAGDCVETWHRLLHRPTYLPLGTTAHKQGRIAGENALGGSRVYEGTLGTQVVKVFDTVVGRTGLSEAEARLEGWDAATAELTTWDHKAYYPGAQALHIRIVADRASGRLLGGQILGRHPSEVAKRVDVLAVALYHGMSVDAVSDLDLSYAPPLSSPWDPVQMATQAWRGSFPATP